MEIKRNVNLIPQDLFLLADPPEQTVDNTTVDEFRSLLDLNLVSYFIFCKVRAPNIKMLPEKALKKTAVYLFLECFFISGVKFLRFLIVRCTHLTY